MENPIHISAIACDIAEPVLNGKSNKRSRLKKFLKGISVAGVLAAVSLGATSAANADSWLVNGVWYNNVCVASDGSYTVYPIANAQPVGTLCWVVVTAQWGTVAP